MGTGETSTRGKEVIHEIGKGLGKDFFDRRSPLLGSLCMRRSLSLAAVASLRGFEHRMDWDEGERGGVVNAARRGKQRTIN